MSNYDSCDRCNRHVHHPDCPYNNYEDYEYSYEHECGCPHCHYPPMDDCPPPIVMGPPGMPGKSAYELAVGCGFCGNKKKWLESLKGITGATGPQGRRGLQGVQGVAGTVGTLVGSFPTLAALQAAIPEGASGHLYVVGTDVFAWDATTNAWIGLGLISGPQGLQGPQGIPGPQGVIGHTGPIGPQGKRGPEGPTGPVAPAITGMNLSVGPTGVVSGGTLLLSDGTTAPITIC